MHIRVAGLALPVAIGIGVAVTSCSSAPGTVKPAVSATRSASGAAISGSLTGRPVAPSSARSVPAGYKRVGNVAQGISIAAPASWVAVNLAKETIESAASKIGVIGHCSGGRQSFLAAVSLRLDAAVDCYGGFVVGTPPISRSFWVMCVAPSCSNSAAAPVLRNGIPAAPTSVTPEAKQ